MMTLLYIIAGIAAFLFILALEIQRRNRWNVSDKTRYGGFGKTFIVNGGAGS